MARRGKGDRQIRAQERRAAKKERRREKKQKKKDDHRRYSITENDEQADALMSLMPPGATFYWLMKPPNAEIPGTNIAGNEDSSMNYWGPAPTLCPMTQAGKDAYNAMHTYSMQGPGAGGNPLGSSSYNQVKRPSTHINVRDKHHWTESPVQSRGRVPMLEACEYSIMMNPVINQIMNNLGVLSTNANGTYEATKKMFEQTGEAVAETVMDLADGDIVEGLKTLGTDVLSKSLKGIFSVAQAFGDDAVKGVKESFSDLKKMEAAGGKTPIEPARAADPLNPYKDLYWGRPTGFKYGFPYTSDPAFDRTNSFGDAGANNIASNLAQASAEISSSIAFHRLLAPGRYIEQPTAFTFTGREKSYTCNFPLFNTKDYNEIIKNWQFIYLLTYQNTPNRQSKDLILPPCIYEAYVPGLWYAKYASITNLNVEFLGARREMEIPVPYLDHLSSDAVNSEDGGKGGRNWSMSKKVAYSVIPDAYQVSITFTEMFANSQNFMYHMLSESMSDKISIS